MTTLAAPSRVRGPHVASVARAMRVLEALAGRPDGVALGRLAADLGYAKAGLSKILGTLEGESFVHQDTVTGRFHLSWRVLALAFGHAERLGLPALCLPLLQQLADETDELVQLAVIDGDDVLFVAKAEGRRQQIRMLPLVGAVAPAHATASGKIWLAHLEEREAVAVMARKGLTRLTERTLTSRERLLRDLREARRRGYALVDEELVEGGRAVAAAVVVAGRVVGSVALSGPSFRVSVSDLQRMAPRVQRTAQDLAAVWPHHSGVRELALASPSPGQGPGRPGRGIA